MPVYEFFIHKNLKPKKMKKLALEPTTNTHKLTANHIEVIYEEGSMIVMRVSGDGIVTHGEHGTIVTEEKFVIKYVQKEMNPLTKEIEDAYD